MVSVHPVETLDIPDLAPYRTMRLQYEHRQRGIFVAEGEKVVRRLLESDLEVISLLLPAKWLEAYRDLLARRPEKQIRAFTAEKSLLESLTGFTMYQGVLAIGRVPPPVRLEQILVRSQGSLLILAVEGVSNAQNLGGLVRNCVALGVDAMLLGESCCSPYLRRAVRSSMGTLFKFPVIESAALAADLKTAKENGLKIVAAHPHTNEKSLWQTDFTQPCIILVGSEGEGISPPTLRLCDEVVAIPMHNDVDSLNVGTAGAIFLYEATRQRSSETGAPAQKQKQPESNL
jgi:tRNA G18 (ribose-2'-O)-methylase SpoU